jgi:hypothetical protein
MLPISSTPESRSGRAAVMVAHPGHELMIHHWMETQRPLYCCLTDGSGGRGRSRIASTSRVLDALGATRGPIYGRRPDKDVYRWLLDGRVEVFVALVEELADALVAAEVECMAGDPVEGFNPVHDVCRFVIDGAVARACRQAGRSIRNYEFTLDAAPSRCPDSVRDQAVWLRLDDAAVERKLNAALQYPEMREETRIALDRFGRGAFALECLRPAAAAAATSRFETEPPSYERSGELRVDQGVYGEVIRYRAHVLPVLRAIEQATRS